MKAEEPLLDIFTDNEFAPKLAKKRNRVFASLIEILLTSIVTVILTFAFGDKIQSLDEGVWYQLTGPLLLIPLFFWLLIAPGLEAISGQSLGRQYSK